MAKKVKFGATGRDVHVDMPLSQVAQNYKPDGFIADMVFPIVPVGKQSDRIIVFSRAEALRLEDDKRAPTTEANKIQRTVSSDTYFADNYALKDAVALEDLTNADPAYTQLLYNERAEYVVSKLWLNWERRITNIVTSGSNVGSFAAVASGWTDLTNSDPLGDVNTGIDNVFDSTGKRPNNVDFGEQAWRNFRRNTNVRNLINGVNNGGGFVSREQVANLLEVDRVLVGASFVNTAEEGQDEVLTTMWGDTVLIHHTPAQPSRDVPSLGYSFRWNTPGLPNMQAERHGMDPKKKAEEVEVGYYQDEKIVGKEYGFLLEAVNSST